MFWNSCGRCLLRCWELFCLEHGIQPDGQMPSDKILDLSEAWEMVGRESPRKSLPRWNDLLLSTNRFLGTYSYIFHHIPVSYSTKTRFLFDSNWYNKNQTASSATCKKLKDHWWWRWCFQHAPRCGCKWQNGKLLWLKNEDDFSLLKEITWNFLYVSWTIQGTS